MLLVVQLRSSRTLRTMYCTFVIRGRIKVNNGCSLLVCNSNGIFLIICFALRRALVLIHRSQSNILTMRLKRPLKIPKNEFRSYFISARKKESERERERTEISEVGADAEQRGAVEDDEQTLEHPVARAAHLELTLLPESHRRPARSSPRRRLGLHERLQEARVRRDCRLHGLHAGGALRRRFRRGLVSERNSIAP